MGRYFVMENVPNLLTSEDGYFKQEIESLFNEMGYSLSMGVYACLIGKENRKLLTAIGSADDDGWRGRGRAQAPPH